MRHRVKGRELVTVGLVLVASACSPGSSTPFPTPPTGSPCSAAPQGGALCIKVLASNGVVGDVVGYLSSSASPLKGKRWRLSLTSYPCDPGTAAKAACAPLQSFPTATRHGVPPIETYCGLPNGKKDTTSAGCHDTLDAEYASHGDWTGFPLRSKGYTVRQEMWLCVSEQTLSGNTWTSPAVDPTPARACSRVTPA
jgi:hypothetical protein